MRRPEVRKAPVPPAVGERTADGEEYRPLNSVSCILDLGSCINMICLLFTAFCLLILHPVSSILHP
jgi:hypothetical protein